MVKVEFTARQTKKIVRLYRKDSWSLNDIAYEMGCSALVIKRVLKEQKVKIRGVGRPRKT